MKLSDYITLSELSKRSGVNYFTLRRRLYADRMVMIDRVGNTVMVRKDARIKKLMRGNNAHH